MKLKEVLDMYGGWASAARRFGMGSGSVSSWKTLGYIPIQTQIRMEILSNGALVADLAHCKKQFAPYHLDYKKRLKKLDRELAKSAK